MSLLKISPVFHDVEGAGRLSCDTSGVSGTRLRYSCCVAKLQPSHHCKGFMLPVPLSFQVAEAYYA